MTAFLKLTVCISVVCNFICSSTAHQWKELERKHRNSYGTRFPGYITSSDISLILCKHGISLAPSELMQVVMAVAPMNTGRIMQADLEEFMARRTQSFGELLHILENDVMKPVVDVYKLMK
jgi:hypothetical protein